MSKSIVCKDCSKNDVKFDSEELGEVELQMKDYHFRPRPNPLGVTWTQIAELVSDTSFDASAEEMLMHRAFQEIKSIEDLYIIQRNDVEHTLINFFPKTY